MATRDELIAEARTWIGTPYVHQARLKGVGVDCIGVIECSANNVGIPIKGPKNYHRIATDNAVEDFLRGKLDEIRIEDARPGDIFVLARRMRRRWANHMVFCTPYGILHCDGMIRPPRVVETTRAWQHDYKIRSCWRFRELED